jgi:oligopeptide/dipeptide ABC transporter ATP-binding protein
MTSLNPVLKIGDQISEAIIEHFDVSKKEAIDKTIDILKKISIPRAEKIINEYPFQLSGGMRQRIMIAMALVCDPKVLIADEPTTALDVTIQAQILELMNELKELVGTSVLFITHDLGVIAEICDEVVVMYCGRVVESGDVLSIFKSPKHPYTVGLLKSIPKLGENVEILDSIPGNVPSPKEMPAGCKFQPRCLKAIPICKQEEPPFFSYPNGQKSRCWLCKKEYGGEL